MSSLAGALDPIEQEPKSEPRPDGVDMSAQDMFADEGTVAHEQKVQDEEMQDLFGEADENVEEIKHNEYVYCIAQRIGSGDSLQFPPEALQRLHQHRLSMLILWTGSQLQSGDIERQWSMLRRRRKSSQPSRCSLKRPLQYRTSPYPGAQTETCATCPYIEMSYSCSYSIG